jgi:hypothetical protein
LVAGDFAATIINATDTATATPAVAESSQKPGLYFLDIPSSFLLEHGPGHYSIVIEVDSTAGPSGPPDVVAVLGNLVAVFDEDFDSLMVPVDELHKLRGLDPDNELFIDKANNRLRVPTDGSVIDIQGTDEPGGEAATFVRQP